MSSTAVLEMQVPSTSSSKSYTVKRYADRSWFCDCPSFRFQKGKPANERICKHVTAVIKIAAADPELDIEV